MLPAPHTEHCRHRMQPALAEPPTRPASPCASRRRALLAAVLACALASAQAERGRRAPFEFDAPGELREAAVSHARLGTTYAYHARDRARPLRLTITALPASEIRAELGSLSDGRCADLFVAALAEDHERFFVLTQERPLRLGESALLQRRWTGVRDGVELTGVVGCARIGRYYFAIDFVDEVRAASQSFPPIRARLRAFRTPDTGAAAP